MAGKRSKAVRIIVGIICAVVVLFFVALVVMIIAFRPGPDERHLADRLGSWNQIDEELVRRLDWEQIVHDSPFQLGEKIFEGYWGPENDQEAYYAINFGTYPSIDGSTVAVPMAIEFAWQHLGLSDEDANSFVGFSTTHDAYLKLIKKEGNVYGLIRSENAFSNENHPVDLFIGTEPSKGELRVAEENQVTLVKKPVCYDAFVFITHRENPVEGLTLDQVRDIYSGKITNWSEVGGNDEMIIAYQREENSGSQTGMINMVMGDIEMLPPEMIEIAVGMGELVDAVAEYQNDGASIGYTYKYYIDTLYRNESIKTLAIDGFVPNEANIRSDDYPLTTFYYGVIRGGEEEAVGGRFLDWMLTSEGQRCIRQAGYIPYLDE
ncbi:MAG: substrate-binding domain-containing protein [Coriobacteriia bacterium]|nr:substrate-binding domain-containing protein [Coriobacteriia bacterium]